MSADGPRLRAPTTILGGFYFFTYAGLGALFPFLPLLLAGRSLTPVQISWVMVITPLFNLLMPPLWGSIADALQARLTLLRIAALGCGLTVLSLLPPWAFLGNLLAVILISTFRAPVGALADAAVYAALATNGGGAYGHIRVWGSIGFGVGALGVGHLVGGTHHPQAMVAVTAAIYLSAGFFSMALPSAPVRRERGVLREARELLLRPAMLVFLCGNVAYYVAHGILDAYLSLHLRGLGFDDGTISLAWAIGVTAEVLVMFVAPPLIARCPGPLLLGASSLIAAARWFFLSRWRRRVPILAMNSLHGLTFGLWYLSMVQEVQSRAPERLRTTLQASAHASTGLGAVIGYLLGGHVFAAGGGPAVFSLAVKIALGSLVAYAAMPLFRRRKG